MNGKQGLDLGHRIVEEHGGKTGADLAVALVARCDQALAGRLAGSQIVSAYGGRRGAGLVLEMARQPSGKTKPLSPVPQGPPSAHCWPSAA